jgi:hypothetical protein
MDQPTSAMLIPVTSYLQAFGQDLRQLFNDFENINPASLSDALGNASPTAAAQSADRQV